MTELKFRCMNCEALITLPEGAIPDLSKADCCDKPDYKVEILGNHGRLTHIRYGEYLSYKNNKFIKTNEGGVEVLNVFEENRKVDYNLKRFKEGIKNWLYIDDEEVLDIVLSGMVAEKVGGDPLWLFLIAPPGGSKTELLRSFTNPEFFHALSDMTSKTLISGLMVSEEDANG